MSPNPNVVAKVILFGIWAKNHNHLTKAYLCLTAASIYGIRAAREFNTQADAALDKLDEERQRPVLVVEP